ncbi:MULTISPECIES: type I-E CRISPR-associated protein Cas6/Cse3/CasE [unclassified Streptomyces]|uniref:type I-E CRISPR-associated protein Cas6/Cse3/CasE n=1 Tax=unclassified Streptomyces TaxID=2593676 RepID=UPI000DAE8F65|nr:MULTISPECIES: type I-E CRISPR-associated protein Cas6/Cse3/CasE [unclassified Streptomyces]PZT76274.1 type I-E CRISPR-associated protein Cas6/Cse3/CasE [Streptomyces sp. AC1-42W]PZT79771.1 type I-E CRISPR-associated protein Cas6/Cse3/CasE [Streptomyces sp. AC1-42T]
MFLTRFRINTARTGARRLLSSPQTLHAAVMASFPDLLPTAATTPDGPRVLWRLDQNARAEVLLYVVGPDKPDLTHLVEQAGWPALAEPGSPGWQTRPYGPFLDRLAAGQRWAFRLTANPVHHIRRKPDEPRKRTAHITPFHQTGWLVSRQESCGFRIVEKPQDERLLPSGTTHQGHEHAGDRYRLTVGDRRGLAFDKERGAARSDGKRAGRVSIATVTYDGHLEVADPDALRRALTHGIGKAKAYGCGLLTLAPLDERG